MPDYSLENLKDQIYHSKTKDYFEEVIQTYYSGCFRSSVVMLYSVVICDLIFKLEDLRDLYNEEKAAKILAEISTLQSENSKSPDWENKLVDMIGVRTTLLEVYDIENIHQLHIHRHLSAHPVLNQSFALFKPSKDNVRSHIRNMLEGVLTKPPILSNKIFDDLLNDVANNRDRFSNDRELEKFLHAKYFNYLKRQTINEIFKKLWKLVFKLDNEKCNENRDINFRVLHIITNINIEEISEYIKNEFSHFDTASTGEATSYLFSYLFWFPKIYHSLGQVAKGHIEYEVKRNPNYTVQGWFMYAELGLYLSDLPGKLLEFGKFSIDYKIFEQALNLAREFNMENEFHDVSICLFRASLNYDGADWNFTRLISPYLTQYSEEQFNKVFEAVNSNFQNYNRNSARYDNRKIKDICTSKFPDFDFSSYYNCKF